MCLHYQLMHIMQCYLKSEKKMSSCFNCELCTVKTCLFSNKAYFWIINLIFYARNRWLIFKTGLLSNSVTSFKVLGSYNNKRQVQWKDAYSDMRNKFDNHLLCILFRTFFNFQVNPNCVFCWQALSMKLQCMLLTYHDIFHNESNRKHKDRKSTIKIFATCTLK